jgi:hypothetical protein
MNWRTPLAQSVLILVTPFQLVSSFGLWLVEQLVEEQA